MQNNINYHNLKEYFITASDVKLFEFHKDEHYYMGIFTENLGNIFEFDNYYMPYINNDNLSTLETKFPGVFKKISDFPRFKSKYNPVQSYKTMNINNSVRIENAFLRLPKVGRVRFRTKQRICGTRTSVSIRKKASGKYYASILCKQVPQVLFKVK